jgi:hypothetical protein
MRFIEDLAVILNSDPVPEGFTKIDVDLNAGAGGDFIWLCYKRSDNPISAIKSLFVADDDQPNPPDNYRKIDVDLNKGAGGKFIWLCYTKIPAGASPIIDIGVFFDAAPNPEWQLFPYDLNKGAEGRFIYVGFKK